MMHLLVKCQRLPVSMNVCLCPVFQLESRSRCEHVAGIDATIPERICMAAARWVFFFDAAVASLPTSEAIARSCLGVASPVARAVLKHGAGLDT